jgi:hypothetical protein
MRVSSDPAEYTSTFPLCIELVEVLAGEELPQAVTASPMQAMERHAAICAPRR